MLQMTEKNSSKYKKMESLGFSVCVYTVNIKRYVTKLCCTARDKTNIVIIQFHII